MADRLRDRYELLEVLGRGGEGRVVKALDHQHDRIVALKIRTVRPGEDREALLTEASVLLAIPPHPHVPLVRDDFFDGDQYVIAMDWVEGTDLSRLLRARGRPGLGASVVLPWLADAASALTHLHGQHPPVVHGDVKPANLVLTASGRVVLVDFGLSSSPASVRRRVGTRGYAAPELVAGGEPSRATDVYSLASTAFTLLTGEPPTGVRPTWEGIDPDQAAELEDAIRLGLATDPAKRPESAGELVERLRAGWQASLPSGVLTFCLTDIVGSTSSWETRPGDMARALAVHDDLVSAVAERHGGRFLESQGEGDSTVTMYPAPGAAVAAAIDIVGGLATASWPGDLPLEIRVGIHTGETDRRRDDYVGPTLNTAARLRGLGEAGEIMVSRVTAALVERHLPEGVSLVSLGPHRLRGMQEPEEVYAVAAPGVRTPPPPTECPYPGLLAFTAEDADRFFGREEVVDDVVARLRTHRFVAVVGASGSGKSSMLRAGVAPRLGAEVITPGAQPLDAVDAIDGPLIIDQFEELFTQGAADDEREAFLDRLLAWPHPVAIGLRADFYGACAEHPGLATAVARHQVLLGPMAPDELRRAITEPATRAGLKIESGLVDVLVAEVAGEPGALPLLSHALWSTWEVRDGRSLTLEGYRSTGGVEGAIATTADRAVDALDPEAQALARRLFVRLVDPGEGTADTRRRAQLSELVPVGGDQSRMDEVLGAVVDARLVTMDEAGVEVAHEALIREWPRLQAWLDEDRDSLRLQRHLTAAATAWDQRRRDPSELYRGSRLAATRDWLATRPPISSLERQFLDESEAAEQQTVEQQAHTNRRLRRRLAITGVTLVIALVAGGAAIVQAKRAATSRDRAEISRVAAVSRSLIERQPDVGLLLAAEAYRRHDDADTRSTLLSALQTHPLLTGLLYGDESGLEAAVFTPDGTLLATPTSDGTRLWDTSTRELLDTLRNEDDIVLAAAISPDGRWLAVPAVVEADGGVTGRLQVWDLSTRTLHRLVDSPAGGLTSAAFSADGQRLVTQGGVRSDRPPTLQAVVWDTSTWEPIGEPWELSEEYPDDRVIAVSPDGERLASPTPGGLVQVWAVDDRKPVGGPLPSAETAADIGPATAIAISPDGTVAIAGDLSRMVLVDPDTGFEQSQMPFPDGQGTAIEFSHDATRLAVSNSDGRTQLFDVASGLELGPALAASSSRINDVTFTADDTGLATAGTDRTGALWRLDGERTIAPAVAGHRASVTELDYTSDGRFLVSSGLDGQLLVRDLEEGSTRTIDLGGEVLTAAIDPTDHWVAAGGLTDTVQLLDIRTGEPGPTLELGDVTVHQVAFDPTSGNLAVAVEDRADPEGLGFTVVWDPETQRETGPRMDLEDGAAIAVAWSPDGEQLAVAADNNLVHLYDADAQHAELGSAIESIDSPILAVAFSPDGGRLATGNSVGVVQQWSADTHRPVGAALKGHTGPVGGVAYSPDGSVLAVSTLGFARSRLWDAATGEAIGQELVTGRTPSTYATFLIMHVQGSRPAFAPDGRSVAIPGYDGTTVLWDLDPRHWLEGACDLVGRNLTQDEWDQYLGRFEYRETCG